jgi:pimeloyl-ACP methyl ester carboxylesterase
MKLGIFAKALYLAVHRPEMVRGLILVRPAWVGASASHAVARELIVRVGSRLS